jgi:hypothetical protein
MGGVWWVIAGTKYELLLPELVVEVPSPEGEIL